MIKTIGYATKHSFTGLGRHEFEREEAKSNEVEIDVLYCGVCHSDIHQVKNEWGNTVYPCMPGHEAVGRVKSVGSAVTRHKIGDTVGVGCMIDSCRRCEACLSGEENYCEGSNSWLATYNGPMVPAMKAPDGQNQYGRDNTFGGYSTSLVVAEDFVLKIPASLRPEVAPPTLCARVTTSPPLGYWNVKKGDKVGIIGFGGLGHMAAKLALALGAEVFLFTEKKEKLEEATRLGATGVLESDKVALEAHKASFDFMLSTVPKKHDLNAFVPLLKRNVTLVVVGALEPLAPVNNLEVAGHRNSIGGSVIGSIAETQDVLDFCAEHNIGPDIEIIDIADVNDAFKKVERGDVRFRYVIDMSTLK